MSVLSNSTVKSAIGVVIIFIAAVAGMYFGMNIGGRSEVPADEGTITKTPSSAKLVVGADFPEVAVVDETGAITTTRQLLADKGGVVLFMELGCPPCVDMTDKWQKTIASGAAEGIQVVGVTINLPIYVHPYRLKHGISFPIYSDTSNTFMQKYDVYSFPYQVVVGKSGKIMYVTENAQERIDFDKVKADLAL